MKKNNEIKSGILIYDFSFLKIEKNNIGDYIQSLAVLNLSSKKRNEMIYVNREELGFSSNEKIKIILNGWFSHNNNTFPINNNLSPLITSFHLSKNIFPLNEIKIKTLKEFQPIGCRDTNTMELLSKNGVEAFFSGCLTLTFPKISKKQRNELRIENDDKNKIVFVVDNLYEYYGSKPKNLAELSEWGGYKTLETEILKEFSKEDLESSIFLTQHSSKELSYDEQFEIAEERLKYLKTAKLVVTTRIHTLMPSMAFGTKTIFIMKNNKDIRFGGLKEYWNYIDYTNSLLSPVINIKRNKKNEIVNNEKFRKLVKPLKKQVENFLN